MAGTTRSVNVQKALTRATGLLRKGDFAAARDALAPVLERFPANRKARQLAREIDMREARLQRPELTPAVTQRAFGLLQRGLLSEALAEAQLLCRAWPDEPVLQNFLATCLFNSGRPEAARKAWERAIQLRESYAEPHLNLSVALWRSGEIRQALAHVERALRIRPDYAAAHAHKGVLLALLNRPKEALAHQERALQLEPENADHHNDIGTTWRFLGEREKARQAFLRATELEPAAGQFHNNLSQLWDFAAEPSYGERLAELAANTALPPEERAGILFARARCAEMLGDRVAFFDLLDQANRTRKDAAPYDRAATDAELQRIRALFADGPLPPVAAGSAGTDPRPLFVIGMPRSGSTLCEQILGRHPQVAAGGELPHTDRILSPFLKDGAPPPAPDALAEARRRWLDDAVLFDPDGPGAHPVIVDKMPMNFRWLGLLAAMFPEARFVNMQRDPMAVAWSIYRLLFPGGVPFAYDAGDIAHYMALYRQMMDFWRRLFPDRILDLDYDALTEDPEPHVRRLVAFCGLDWDDACLDFGRSTAIVRTASVDQVRKGLYRGSSQAWREYARELQPLKAALEQAGVPVPDA